MKKSAIVLMIVCLVVFVTSTTAAVALTVRHAAWDDLSLESSLAMRLERILDRFESHPIDFGFGPSQSYSIDEQIMHDFEGLRRIEVTGLAENMTLQTQGSQVKARIHGTYRARSTPIRWQSERRGDVLKIGAVYPRHGLTRSSLEIDLVIPAGFEGEVSLHTLSGDTDLSGSDALSWQKLKFDSLSGDLHIASTALEHVTFSTLSGNVRLRQVEGKVSGDTMSGDVHLDIATLQPIDVETLSGKVYVQLDPAAQADIDFSTLSGRFSSQDLSLSFSKQENRHVEATLNGGGTSIEIETMSGNVSFSGR